jgi:hypothetical protein
MFLCHSSLSSADEIAEMNGEALSRVNDTRLLPPSYGECGKFPAGGAAKTRDVRRTRKTAKIARK